MSKTYMQQFTEALACQTREDADIWLELQAAQMVLEYPENCPDREQAKRIIRSNLGYMSGYYGLEEGQKVYELFDAIHPVFGTPQMRAVMSVDDMLTAGKLMAEGKLPHAGV